MKKPAKSPKPPRRTEAKKPPAKATPAAPPKGRPEKKAKPSAAPAATSKPATQPAAAAPASTAAPAPEQAPAPVDRRPARETIPGEPIPGPRFSRALKYARAVVADGDDLVFDHTPEGVPFIHGHGQRAAHEAFLPAKGACHVRGLVAYATVSELIGLLDGVRRSNPTVRIGEDGRVYIQRSHGQPDAHHDLDPRPRLFDYKPPVEHVAETALVPLRIDGSANARATKWPESIVQTHQAANGIEWVTLTAREGGELLARAVLAEDGHDLYPEDERQVEIPGSRTAGQKPRPPKDPVQDAVSDLVDDMKAAAQAAGAGLAVEVDGKRVTLVEAPAATDEKTVEGEVTIEAGGEKVTIAAEPSAAPPALPTPGTRPVVIEVPGPIFDALTQAERDALRFPTKSVQVWWFVGPEVITSSSMNAENAVATAALLEGYGLRCGKREATTRHGNDIDLWTVECAPKAAD